MESREIFSDGATHELNISTSWARWVYEIGGHTQMNKRRQYKQLGHEAWRTQTNATFTEAQLGLFPEEVCHVY